MFSRIGVRNSHLRHRRATAATSNDAKRNDRGNDPGNDRGNNRSTDRTIVRYSSTMAFRWQQIGTESQGALFDDHQLVERHIGRGEFRGLEFLHVNAKTILNRVPAASRMPFEWTINPYRGCSHACTYCFARPTHAYLDLDTGEGFDRQIVVKINAVERAGAELTRSTRERASIAFGTNTDPYQRCEGKYHLMRGLLRVLIDTRTPFSILTKSTLVLRDLDLLTTAASFMAVSVNFSIGTLDADVWRLTEPGTPHPQRRIEAVAKLNDAGIRCGILMAPILPGLSDSEASLRAVVEAGLDAGAVRLAASALYLHPVVRVHYLERLKGERPDVAIATDRLFGDRASQPSDVQRTLSARIRSLVDDGLRRRGQQGRQGRQGRTVDTERFMDHEFGAAPPTAAAASNQLSLLDVG